MTEKPVATSMAANHLLDAKPCLTVPGYFLLTVRLRVLIPSNTQQFP